MTQGKPSSQAKDLSRRIRVLTEMGSEDFAWLLVLAAEIFAIASQATLDGSRPERSRQVDPGQAAKDLITRMDGLIREFLPGLEADQTQAAQVLDTVEDACRQQDDFAEDLRILNRSILGFCNKHGRTKRDWNDDLRNLSLLARGFSAKHAGNFQPDR